MNVLGGLISMRCEGRPSGFGKKADLEDEDDDDAFNFQDGFIFCLHSAVVKRVSRARSSPVRPFEFRCGRVSQCHVTNFLDYIS